MSLDTIRAGVVTILEAVSGVENVHPEADVTVDAERGEAGRISGGRTHYWTVAVRPAAGDGGAGYTDHAAVVTVEGWLGVVRDTDDPSSAGPAATLFAAVVAALESPTNAAPGGAIDRTDVAVEPLRVRQSTLGLGTGLAHFGRITVTYLY